MGMFRCFLTYENSKLPSDRDSLVELLAEVNNEYGELIALKERYAELLDEIDEKLWEIIDNE